tara:strand:+ start:618 stop:893 length:276 start_codon:yes stop_codon:yes gene_type:complete
MMKKMSWEVSGMMTESRRLCDKRKTFEERVEEAQRWNWKVPKRKRREKREMEKEKEMGKEKEKEKEKALMETRKEAIEVREESCAIALIYY